MNFPRPGRPILVTLVAAFVLLRCLAVVPAGHVGVVDLFGSVSERALEPGLRFVNPLARVVRLSVQTQEVKETLEVPSKEGLTMNLDVSLLFHLDPAQAPEVYRSVGVDWVPVLVLPQFRSVVRGVTASFESRALYTAERESLAKAITSELGTLVAARGVVIEAAPLRKMALPARVAAAVEEKLSAEQESQRMQFVLTKEKQEAERKRIEAQGIADFQHIVSQGLSDGLLRWKGIEATTRLAESNNTKLVVVGAGKDGLPVILGGQ
jgi:regulator of protease activity HflC (stomatin/prohibitin superfamily)